LKPKTVPFELSCLIYAKDGHAGLLGRLGFPAKFNEYFMDLLTRVEASSIVFSEFLTGLRD